VAPTILVLPSQLLLDGHCDDESRYERHDARQEAWEKPRALAALERWGDTVPLSPVTEAAPGDSFAVSSQPLVVPGQDQDIGGSVLVRLCGGSISWEK
jgi:hypothetical protein